MKRVPSYLRAISILLVLTIGVESLVAGIDSKSSMYIGGTVTMLKEGDLGTLVDKNTNVLFKLEKGDTQLQIPYDKVTGLSYGQHAGRRVGSTIALGVTTLGIGALPLLFSKKRRHYLTIEYTDADGKGQAAIFEVGKDAVRTMLKTIEVRSGKKI